MNPLADRGLKDVRVLGARHPHGVRLRYMSGCKCLKCRMANSNYETARAAARRRGDWNGLVDAAPVRSHLRKLSRAGVGYKTVCAAADVGKTCIFLILCGKRHRIRARAARRVLAITPAARADHSIIKAGATWRRLNQLLEEGFTRTRLARELGSKATKPALQMQHDYVLAVTALKVERLWRRYMR